MFARMLLVELDSGDKSARIDLANRWYAAVSTLPGFKSVQFLSDESNGEYGYISFWETFEQAEDAGNKLGEHLPKVLQNMSDSRIHVRIFEAYEPSH